MFYSLFYLVLVLLCISLGAELRTPDYFLTEGIAFLAGLALYGTTLVFLRFFAKLPPRSYTLHGVNLVLLLFFICYHLILGSDAWMLSTFGLTAPIVLFSLALYFFALNFYHSRAKNASYARAQLLFLLPFTLPFLLLRGAVDLFSLLPLSQKDSEMATAFFYPLFASLLLFFLPYAFQKIWNCKPLAEGLLKERLKRLCEKADFKVASMCTWSIMENAHTAAILGVTPRFRYVLFTKRLQQDFTDDEIEAILAHEIGHSKYHHLLLYPFIIFGMLIAGALLFQIVSPTLELFFIEHRLPFYLPTFFVLYSLFLAFYFRFIFGFFSRQFERQADLYVIELGLSPHHLIKALDHIGVVSGGIHKDPNWHHYSIEKRIEQLERAIEDKSLVGRHKRWVQFTLACYFLIVGIACLLLLLFS